MALRKHVVVIDGDPAKNRDVGKTFLITEMDAFKAEWWAIKLTLALGKAGMELPEEVQGMAAIAAAGLGALMKIDPADAKPLLDEMLECAVYQHKPNHPPLPLIGVVEEPSTLLTLRKEIFKLHTGFLAAGSTPTT